MSKSRNLFYFIIIILSFNLNLIASQRDIGTPNKTPRKRAPQEYKNVTPLPVKIIRYSEKNGDGVSCSHGKGDLVNDFKNNIINIFGNTFIRGVSYKLNFSAFDYCFNTFFAQYNFLYGDNEELSVNDVSTTNYKVTNFNLVIPSKRPEIKYNISLLKIACYFMNKFAIELILNQHSAPEELLNERIRDGKDAINFLVKGYISCLKDKKYKKYSGQFFTYKEDMPELFDSDIQSQDLISEGLLDTRTGRGFSPLSKEDYLNKFKEVLTYICHNGANFIKARGYTLTKPLNEAIKHEADEIVPLLIDMGAPVNARSHGGKTPLYFAAVKNKNLKLVKKLIKRGANKNLKIWHKIQKIKSSSKKLEPEATVLEILKYLKSRPISKPKYIKLCNIVNYLEKQT